MSWHMGAKSGGSGCSAVGNKGLPSSDTSASASGPGPGGTFKAADGFGVIGEREPGAG